MHKRGPKEQRPGVKSLYGYNSMSCRTLLKRKNEVFKNYVRHRSSSGKRFRIFRSEAAWELEAGRVD